MSALLALPFLAAFPPLCVALYRKAGEIARWEP